MKTQYFKFKLYLEGKEVPFSQISLAESGFAPSTCTITMPGNSNATKLLPGTLAHLFYIDGDDSYIIFEGELTGVNFSKATGNELVQLQFYSIANTLQRTFQIPAAFISLVAPRLSQFLLIDSTDTKSYAVTSPEVQQALNNLQNPLTTLEEFFEQIEKNIGEDSDKLLEKTFSSIFTDAETTNEWYGYFSKSMKMLDRLLVIPNKGARKAVHKQAGNILAQSRIATEGNLVSYLKVLYIVMDYIGYTMIQSSSTGYGKSGNKSFVFMPNTDYLAPVKCNIFFGDSIQNAGFTKNMMAENTRYSLSTGTLNLVLDGSGYSINPTFFAPTVTDYNEKTGKIDYTIEEQYIGIIPGFGKSTGLDIAYSQQTKLEDAKDNKELEQTEINAIKDKGDPSYTVILEADVTQHAANITLKSYWDQVYAKRSFSISVPYNPNRMAGFAGIVIDKNLPSVAGTIKSINTQIDSKGMAVSSITFIRPRTVWEFNQNGEGLDTADPTPPIQQWFDKDMFDYDNIGKKVYNKILGKDSTTEDLSSIFYYKGLPEYAEIQALSKGSENVLGKALAKDQDAIKNSALLGMITQAIKDRYYSLSDEARPIFERSANKRDLKTESSYWEFLFSGKTKKDSTAEAHPSNYAQSDIYRDLENDDDIISINKETYNSYKPFILQRLRAVEAIK